MASTREGTGRTSASHPLQIAELALPAGGMLGLTLCPGKVQPDAAGGAWLRNLDLDLDVVADWGAVAVVTLMREHELRRYQVAGIGAATVARVMAWVHLPIDDGGVPDAAFDRSWATVAPRLRAHLARGARIVIHCRGGLGRTGTVAAMLWLDAAELGDAAAAAERAITLVRAARPGAIENRQQEAYIRRYAEAVAARLRQRDAARGRAAAPATLRDRYRGCLLGGAVGDALGAPVEFVADAEIRGRFGDRGVREFAEAYGVVGAITDDTQMTLFTAEGLVRGWVRGELKGVSHLPDVVHHATLRWLRTQGESPVVQLEPDGWLYAQRALHARRGPGNTCLSALRVAKAFGPLAENDSKGCGGVMRVAPVGLYTRGAKAFEMAAECAHQTHGHPSGYLTAGWMATCVGALVDGRSLGDAIAEADAALAAAPEVRDRVRNAGETAQALAGAIAAARAVSERPTTERPVRIPADLGAGWVAEEALAIGLYCALLGERWVEQGAPAAEAFEDAVSLAVSHGGDSDSTGSIAGQLLGARFGVAAIPARWADAVELRDVALRLADVLADIREGRAGAEALWDDFPGW
ncbi:MAG: ADP-ribosylglycohydrolase family protein [Deltaproteobacteria bacterium]|nr:ADP-ribosylglycohydrolase family protein [Deltaproteobacteria bacterium]